MFDPPEAVGYWLQANKKAGPAGGGTPVIRALDRDGAPTYEQAYDLVLKVRPVSTLTNEPIRPNPLIVRIADKLMGHEGRMLEYVCRRKGDLEYLKTVT